MAGTEEIRRTMVSEESREVAVMLESLDERSIVLAKAYLSALADRQRMDGQAVYRTGAKKGRGR